MCGRYTLAPGELTLFSGRFGVAAPPKEAAGYNIAPGRAVAAIVRRDNAAPACEMFHWGLIPAWSESAEKQYKMINARAETVREKRAYSGLLAEHRCLIPADGFYEWQPQPEGPKQPWWFHLPSSEPFAFAGLWTSWQPEPDVEPVGSCTILTSSANEIVAPVHSRMPLILNAADERAWLDADVSADDAIARLDDCANRELIAHPVSRAVNNTRNIGAELIEPIEQGGSDPSAGALF